MTRTISYIEVFKIPNINVVSFINRINTLFNASYTVLSNRGCKWCNVRSLEAALNECYYYDVVDLIHIDVSITHLDQLRRSLKHDEAPELAVYREAMAKLINESIHYLITTKVH